MNSRRFIRRPRKPAENKGRWSVERMTAVIVFLSAVAGLMAIIWQNDCFGFCPRDDPQPSAIAQPQRSSGAGTGSPPENSSPPPSRVPPPEHAVFSNRELVNLAEQMELPDAEPYEDTQRLETDGMVIDVPAVWEDSSVKGWLVDNKPAGRVAIATPDEAGFYTTYSVPGFFFGASAQNLDWDGEDILEHNPVTFHLRCAFVLAGDFESSAYHDGRYELYNDCGEGPIVAMRMGARARDNTHYVYRDAFLTSTADLEALLRALESFSYDPTVAPLPTSPIPTD